MDRRQFLKRCFHIGGYAAIAQLGLGAVEDARGWGILPALVGGGGIGNSFATWDQITESGWGDSDNTNITLYENTNLGGNETGQGANLSEANRVLTQVGGVAGATGTPPSRDLGGNTKYFTMETALPGVLTRKTTWAFITELANCNPPAASHGILRISGSTGDLLYMRGGAGNNDLYVLLRDGGVERINGTTVDNWTVTGKVYFFAQCNGTTTSVGWSNSRPTSMSAIPAGQKVSYAGTVQFANFTSEVSLFYDNGNTKGITGQAYYSIFSSSVLIGA